MISGAKIALFVLYFFCFIGATIEDLKTLEIPNRIPVCLLFIGVLKILAQPDTLLQAVVGLIGIGLLLFLPDIFVEGIGGGDIKLSAAAAFVIGFERSLIALILSFVPAVIYGLLRKKGRRGQTQDFAQRFALAPFLAAGFSLAYFL